MQQSGIGHEFVGLGIVFGPDGIGTELVDALWCQAKMRHHRYASIENALDGVDDFSPTLKFQGIAATLFHDLHSVFHALLAVDLITAERHVAHHEGTLHATHHRPCMVNHLFNGHGQRGGIACHYVGGRVAHQYAIDACTVNDACRCKIIRCQHGDFLSSSLHLNEAVCSDLAIVTDQISNHNFTYV